MSDCGCDEDEFAALAMVEDDDTADTEPDPRGTTVRVFRDQLIAPYGKPTGDKRRFASGALTSRELPVGVKWQRADNQGHSESISVGRIDQIDYRDDGVYASGVIFDPDPVKTPRWAEDCAEAYGLLKQKVIGPSVDLDDMDFHQYDGEDAEEFANAERPEIEVTRGRISAITLVQIPAFAEARPFTLDEQDADEYAASLEVGLVAAGVYVHDDQTPVTDGAWDVAAWLETAMDYEGTSLYSGPEGDLFPVAEVNDGELRLNPAAVADAISVMAFKADQVQLGEGTKQVLRERLTDLAVICDLPMPPWVDDHGALVAAAMPSTWLPDAVAFEDPKLDRLTPLTVRDGRVFGHLASWQSCHIGFKHCVKAPRSRSNYAHFHVGEIETSGGALAVGKITLGGGHADTRLGFQAAAEHYDDAGSAVAAVRAGDDKFGIWIAGVALPGAEEKFASLPLFPLSGDWRRVGGHMELVAALAVNTPGFGIPRVHEAAGRSYALVAAGVVADVDTFSSEFEEKHHRGFAGRFVRKLLGHHDGDGKDAGTGGGGHLDSLSDSQLTEVIHTHHDPRTRMHAQHVQAERNTRRKEGGGPQAEAMDRLTKGLDANPELNRRLTDPGSRKEQLESRLESHYLTQDESDELDRLDEPDYVDDGDEGPTRKGNLKRLQELEDMLDGGPGLDEAQHEEYLKLQKLYRRRERRNQEARDAAMDLDYGAQVVAAFRNEAEAARQARIVAEDLADLDGFALRSDALKAASIF